jgi:hypothetical protein
MDTEHAGSPGLDDPYGGTVPAGAPPGVAAVDALLADLWS